MAQAMKPQAGSRKLTRWLSVLAYVALIFSLSAQPHLAPPFHFQNSDKLAHLAEYGGLGFLLARAMRATLPARSAVVTALLTVLLGMGIGGTDEWFQSFIPGRESSVFDWFADSLGITFAQIVFFAVAKDEEL